MIKTIYRTMLVTILLPLLFSLSLSPAYGGEAARASATPPPIRVAFPSQEGLTEKDEDGNYYGYTYDYLQEIAQYTGWEYEIVEIPGTINEALTKTLEMLERGEVDLAGGVLRDTKTEQQFDFPEYGYGYSYMTLVLPEDNTSINETNYQEKANLRIAVHGKAEITRLKLDAFCRINNISYELVWCETEEEMNKAVRDGTADVRIGTSLTPVEGMATVAQFDGVQFYFAVPKGSVKLVQELNQSILAIKQAKPFFENELNNRYFYSKPSRVYFTKQENSFLDTAEPIRVVLPMNVPIQAAGDGGEAWGISVDILRNIKEKTGLDFTFKVVPDYEAGLSALKAGEADIISGIPYSYELAREYGLLMSESFLSAQSVLAVPREHSGESAGKRIAVVERQTQEQYQHKIDAIPYSTALECMEAVVGNEADGALLSLYSAEYLGHFGKFRQLQLIPQGVSSVEFCFGIKKEGNFELISILNKVIRSIPDGEMEMLVQQNMSKYSEQITLKSLIESNPVTSLGIVSSIFLVLLLMGGGLFTVRVRSNARLAIENKRYERLYEMANEYIYEYDCQKDLLTLSKSFAQKFGLSEKITGFQQYLESAGDQGAREQQNAADILRWLQNGIPGDEMRYRILNGEERWYRNTYAQIDDAHGQAHYIVGKLTDVQDERLERERLEHQLKVDGLTQLYNAVSVKHIIGEHLKSLETRSMMIMLDIDYFKEINDSLGHYTGDIALSDLAALLRELAGEDGVLGRLGGDEFVIYLRKIDNMEAAEMFCRTLCRRARRVYGDDAGTVRPLSVSIGAVVVEKSCEFEKVYQAADKLLYRSKMAGRDQYTVSGLEI